MKKNLGKILLIVSALMFGAVSCNKTSDNTKSVNQKNGGVISYLGKKGKTVLELLEEKNKVEIQSFGKAGENVVSINGIKPASGQFWQFFINGQPALVGPSQYITKDGDKIEWKIEKANPKL